MILRRTHWSIKYNQCGPIMGEWLQYLMIYMLIIIYIGSYAVLHAGALRPHHGLDLPLCHFRHREHHGNWSWFYWSVFTLILRIHRQSMTIHINLKVLSSILYLALFPFWCFSACSSFRNGGGRPCWLAILTNGTELTVTASVSHWEEEELWWGREDGLAWWAAPQEATTTASTCPPGTGRQSCPPPCRGLIRGVATPAM